MHHSYDISKIFIDGTYSSQVLCVMQTFSCNIYAHDNGGTCRVPEGSPTDQTIKTDLTHDLVGEFALLFYLKIHNTSKFALHFFFFFFFALLLFLSATCFLIFVFFFF